MTRLKCAAVDNPGYAPPPPLGPCCGGGLRLGADGLYSTPLGASPDRAGDTPPGGGAAAPAAAFASVGEYCGEVGLYCGLVGEYCGLVGLYCGLQQQSKRQGNAASTGAKQVMPRIQPVAPCTGCNPKAVRCAHAALPSCATKGTRLSCPVNSRGGAVLRARRRVLRPAAERGGGGPRSCEEECTNPGDGLRWNRKSRPHQTQQSSGLRGGAVLRRRGRVLRARWAVLRPARERSRGRRMLSHVQVGFSSLEARLAHRVTTTIMPAL